MNIFVTSMCPIESARVLDDKRVIKMTLESTQLLSNVLHSIDNNGPYKKTHWNHPCSIWAKESKLNYIWLLMHFKALCNEYTFRYNKTHKCEQLLNLFQLYVNKLNTEKESTFINCTTNHKHVKNVFDAYKLELNLKWKNDKKIPNWTNRTRPNWG